MSARFISQFLVPNAVFCGSGIWDLASGMSVQIALMEASRAGDLVLQLSSKESYSLFCVVISRPLGFGFIASSFA